MSPLEQILEIKTAGAVSPTSRKRFDRESIEKIAAALERHAGVTFRSQVEAPDRNKLAALLAAKFASPAQTAPPVTNNEPASPPVGPATAVDNLTLGSMLDDVLGASGGGSNSGIGSVPAETATAKTAALSQLLAKKFGRLP